MEISSDGTRSAPLVSAGHPRGCPTCQKDRIFGTCDGWKRHMKEHETLYPCDVCARSGTIRSYSRRINLLRHLKTHGFSNNASSTLANTWKKSHEKRFFGCGFCVFLCNSLTEQLNHIDSVHFRNFSSISEWDTNKVIRGLLLQPDLSLLVQNLLGQPYARGENLSWHPSTVHDLQLRLQERKETTEALARITVDQIEWDSTARTNNELTSALNFGYTCQDASVLTASPPQIGTVNENHSSWTGLASQSELTNTQGIQCQPHSLQPTPPNYDDLNVVNQQFAPLDGQLDKAHSSFTDYLQTDLGIQSNSQSNKHHTQGVRYSLLSTWKNRVPSNVNQRLHQNISDTNETSVKDDWPSTPFAVSIDTTTTPCPTAPSYQHAISNVPQAAALAEGLAPNTCSSAQTVARVLSIDARPKKQTFRQRIGKPLGRARP